MAHGMVINMSWQDILKAKRNIDFNADEFYIGKYNRIEQYGGAEEGGWWYYNYKYLGESVGPLPKKEAIDALKALNNDLKPPKKFYENLPEEDKDIARGFTISSGIAYMLENKKGDQEDMQRQYYE